MQRALEDHLTAVAREMGAYLRGFEDPRVHLGSSERFAAQFRKLFAHPALHPAGRDRPVSYAEAAQCCRLAAPGVSAPHPETPVFTMMRGLAEAAPFSTGLWGALPAQGARRDIARLLRIPCLTFYLQAGDSESFGSEAARVAARNEFPLAMSQDLARIICPACRSPFALGGDPPVPQCPACNATTEVLSPLPLVSGFAAFVSYDYLRELVALEAVETYQEESNIELSHFRRRNPQ